MQCPGCYLLEVSREDNGQKGTRIQLIPTDSPEYQRVLDEEERRVRREREEAKKAQAEGQTAQQMMDAL